MTPIIHDSGRWGVGPWGHESDRVSHFFCLNGASNECLINLGRSPVKTNKLKKPEIRIRPIRRGRRPLGNLGSGVRASIGGEGECPHFAGSPSRCLPSPGASQLASQAQWGGGACGVRRAPLRWGEGGGPQNKELLGKQQQDRIKLQVVV